MTPFWSFTMEHPYLGCSLAILGCSLAICTLIVFAELICRLYRYSIRLVNIWKNGWPPPHCDSDGDLKQ